MTKRVSRVSVESRLNPHPDPLKSSQTTKGELAAMVRNMMYGAGLDFDEKVIKRQKKNDLLQIVNNMASVVSRAALQTALGQSFYGKRDLYEVLGWKKDLQFTDYMNMYERNGIAARVVDVKAGESWRKFPVLHDGKGKKDYDDNTPFLAQWLDMVDKLKLPNVFNELDKALGISRFALIVIGVKGDTKYSEPLQGGTHEIEFMRVLDEGQITMSDPVTDSFSSRYGLPNTYNCQFEENGQYTQVHWTRVIHFKQGRSRSNVYGIPGLQKSFNFLADLEKVAGSSSEAFWQHIRRVLIVTAREGATFPVKGTPEGNAVEEQVDNYEHQMSLLIRLKNMDVTQIASQIMDGRNQTDLLIGLISGTEGIPQRILIGSERGELASSQDQENWASVVNARQTQTCEPWLRSFVEYTYLNGFIPVPKSGKFSVEWQSLYEMNPVEKMAVATAEADFLDKISSSNIESVADPKDIVEKHLDGYRIKDVPESEGEGNDKTPPTNKTGAKDEEDEDAEEVKTTEVVVT